MENIGCNMCYDYIIEIFWISKWRLKLVTKDLPINSFIHCGLRSMLVHWTETSTNGVNILTLLFHRISPFSMGNIHNNYLREQKDNFTMWYMHGYSAALRRWPVGEITLHSYHEKHFGTCVIAPSLVNFVWVQYLRETKLLYY